MSLATYDHENRIKSVSNTPFTPKYDGDGLRTRLDEGVNGVTDYTWDVASALPVIIQDSDLTYVYGLDLISATDASGQQTYFTYDACPPWRGLGSVTGLTDGTGAVAATYAYDVFGGIRAQTGASPNYWQFAGEQSDAATGFQYLRSRYYDPAAGRFLTRDPLMGFPLEAQRLNPYTYGLNNPVNQIDPRGLASESVSPLLQVQTLDLFETRACLASFFGLLTFLSIAIASLLLPPFGFAVWSGNIIVAGFAGAVAVYFAFLYVENCTDTT